ncbi:MAG: dihydroxyacetone kinase subunit L [Methylobacteriaceae bacterium]|nr:dihydroxyacetone kinase subunit L [Methylobacteriaceae bacterium]
MSNLDVGAATEWIKKSADVLNVEKKRLTELDAAIGDSDHGENMARGFNAVTAKIGAAAPADMAALFKTVGMTLITTVGGASGPLYGTFFLEIGKKTAGKAELDTLAWADALDAGIAGIVMRGKAELNDKTMLDALLPAAKALRDNAAKPLAEAADASAASAEAGMAATIPLVARKGRASYLGERSAGHQDPGATSASLLLRAFADTVK